MFLPYVSRHVKYNWVPNWFHFLLAFGFVCVCVCVCFFLDIVICKSSSSAFIFRMSVLLLHLPINLRHGKCACTVNGQQTAVISAIWFSQIIAGCHCELCSNHPWEPDCNKWCCACHWPCPYTNWYLNSGLHWSRRWALIF